MSRAENEAGFSTVEVLVAFTVPSLGLTVLLQTTSQSAITLDRARKVAAELGATSRLDAELRAALHQGSMSTQPGNDDEVQSFALRSEISRGMTLIVSQSPGNQGFRHVLVELDPPTRK